MKGLLARTGVLLLTAFAAGLLLNAIRPDGAAFSGEGVAGVCAAGTTFASVETISPERANTLCAQPGVLIADARSADAFARGHAVNAVHLPCDSGGKVAASVGGLLAAQQTVIVYADTAAAAGAVAESLVRRSAGRSVRVVVLAGGFSAWERAGFACVSGPCPDCEDAKEHQHP